jgi:CDP-diglyceride synthetase
MTVFFLWILSCSNGQMNPIPLKPGQSLTGNLVGYNNNVTYVFNSSPNNDMLVTVQCSNASNIRVYIKAFETPSITNWDYVMTMTTTDETLRAVPSNYSVATTWYIGAFNGQQQTSLFTISAVKASPLNANTGLKGAALAAAIIVPILSVVCFAFTVIAIVTGYRIYKRKSRGLVSPKNTYEKLNILK